jgi:hypothetical protein
MKFILFYEFGTAKIEYCIIEHEDEYSAQWVFEQQNPHLKAMCIRELKSNNIYLDNVYTQDESNEQEPAEASRHRSGLRLHE